ncbi:MAG: EVE domain-containing protein [Candidatus Riflebacteria bacterium]|nr:EVE domain-containing protein [Candidatus Riflebacteria bacterium]
MNHWIIALPRPDMEHCIRIGKFGKNSKGVMGKVKAGDKVACYVSGECKIIALGEATSDYYMDDSPVFKAEGVFPDRFDFSAKPVGKAREVDIKTMVDDLQFISNKLYWSVFFRTGIKQIPQPDWTFIEKRLSGK